MRSTLLRWRRRAVGIFGLSVTMIAALLVGTTSAGGAYSNPGVSPPNSHAFGKTYGAWSAAWWQYVLAQPGSSSPLSDPTGASCAVGQSGPVFFLVGANNSGTFTRDQCVVPAGKALFFPLVNVFDVHVACTPVTEPTGLCDANDTPNLIWKDLQNFGFHVQTLFATIDGVKVQSLNPDSTPYRACAGPVANCSAPAFPLTFPADNLFGLPAGTYAPAVADGVYLLLPPLHPGAHTITFGGSDGFAGSLITENITYKLVVSSS